MKAYTDIEQSKKLAEILPIESADGYWFKGFPPQPYMVYTKGTFNPGEHIPCWSLAALLDVLPTIDDRNAIFCKDIRYDKWHVFYHGTAMLPLIDTERYHDVVDACCEMIIKLHEQKLL